MISYFYHLIALFAFLRMFNYQELYIIFSSIIFNCFLLPLFLASSLKIANIISKSLLDYPLNNLPHLYYYY